MAHQVDLLDDFWDDEEECDQLVDYCSNQAEEINHSGSFLLYFKESSFKTFRAFFIAVKDNTFFDANIKNTLSGTYLSSNAKITFIKQLKCHMKTTFSRKQIELLLGDKSAYSHSNSLFEPASILTTLIDKVEDTFIIASTLGPLSEQNDPVPKVVSNLLVQSPIESEKGENIMDIDKIFSGQDLYFLYLKTHHKECILEERFSCDCFDFDENTTKPTEIWQIHPSAALKECQTTSKSNKVVKKFPEYFSRFSFDIFKRLGKIFPYEVSWEVVKSISSRFCGLYNLNAYFQSYKKATPGGDFGSMIDCSEMLAHKIKHKFKYRSQLLKDKRFWLYRPRDRKFEEKTPKEKKKKKIVYYQQNDDSELNELESKYLEQMIRDFDYSLYKSELMKKMDCLDKIKKDKIEDKIGKGPKKRGRKRKSVEIANGLVNESPEVVNSSAK